jgi:hypothetical protein
MADAFRYPFRRTVNFAGTYLLPQGKAALSILEDGLFQDAAGAISGTAVLTFVTTGAAVAASPGSLVGTAAMVISGSAVLVGRADASGAVSLIIGAAGNIVALPRIGAARAGGTSSGIDVRPANDAGAGIRDNI